MRSYAVFERPGGIPSKDGTVSPGFFISINCYENRHIRKPTLINTIDSAPVQTQRGTKIISISAPTIIMTSPAVRVALGRRRRGHRQLPIIIPPGAYYAPGGHLLKGHCRAMVSASTRGRSTYLPVALS